jgi:hypothetical protein
VVAPAAEGAGANFARILRKARMRTDSGNRACSMMAAGLAAARAGSRELWRRQTSLGFES